MLEFAHLLSLLSLVHGIVLGGILFFISSEKKPTRYLGIFLCSWGFSFVPNVLRDFGIFDQYPSLIFLPIRFYFLSFPILYLYVKRIVLGARFIENKLHFLPGLVEFVIFAGLCIFIAPENKLSIQNSEAFWKFEIIYHVVVSVYVLCYLMLIFKLIAQNKVYVEDYYSDLGSKLLKWIKALNFGFTFLTIESITVLLIYLFGIDQRWENSFEVSIVIFTVENCCYWLLMYWALFFSYRQYGNQLDILPVAVVQGAIYGEISSILVKSLNEDTSLEELSEEDKLEYGNIYRRLVLILEKSKCYTDPELTIANLAQQVEVHHRKLSKVINFKANCNFNLFINRYRVEEAKRIMADPERARLITLETVGQEVGFKSRSSIYTAFKRIEGKTPAKFIFKP